MSEQSKLSLSELESYRNQQGKSIGKCLRFYCPIHGGDHQRSLALTPDTGHFVCFTCGAWGYLEENKQEWLAEQQRKNGGSYPKSQGSFREMKKASNLVSVKQVLAPSPVQPKPEPPVRRELSDILTELQHALPNSLGEKYLELRKIPVATALMYGAGYAAWGKWPHVKDGRPVRQWRSGRIVFPHTNPQGETVNLYGRALALDQPVPKEYKHDHLPGVKGVFNAQALLADTVFVCEGCFNALSLITVGYPNACAIFGVFGLRWEWVQAKRIVFCLDQDQAGENWRKLAWEGVLRGKEIFWLPPEVYGGYKDLNEVWMATGRLDIGTWQKSPWAQVAVPSQTWQVELQLWPIQLQEAWQEQAITRYCVGDVSQEVAERLAFEDVKRQIDGK